MNLLENKSSSKIQLFSLEGDTNSGTLTKNNDILASSPPLSPNLAADPFAGVQTSQVMQPAVTQSNMFDMMGQFMKLQTDYMKRQGKLQECMFEWLVKREGREVPSASPSVATTQHPPKRKYVRRKGHNLEERDVLYKDGTSPEQLQKVEKFKAWMARYIFLVRALVPDHSVAPIAFFHVDSYPAEDDSGEEEYRVLFNPLLITSGVITMQYSAKVDLRGHSFVSIYHELPIPVYVAANRESKISMEPKGPNAKSTPKMVNFIRHHVTEFLEMDSSVTNIHKFPFRGNENHPVFANHAKVNSMAENWFFMSFEDFVESLLRDTGRSSFDQKSSLDLLDWEKSEQNPPVGLYPCAKVSKSEQNVLFVSANSARAHFRIVQGTGGDKNRYQNTLVRRSHFPHADNNKEFKKWMNIRKQKYPPEQKVVTEHALARFERDVNMNEYDESNYLIIKKLMTRPFQHIRMHTRSRKRKKKRIKGRSKKTFKKPQPPPPSFPLVEQHEEPEEHTHDDPMDLEPAEKNCVIQLLNEDEDSDIEPKSITEQKTVSAKCPRDSEVKQPTRRRPPIGKGPLLTPFEFQKHVNEVDTDSDESNASDDEQQQTPQEEKKKIPKRPVRTNRKRKQPEPSSNADDNDNESESTILPRSVPKRRKLKTKPKPSARSMRPRRIT